MKPIFERRRVNPGDTCMIIGFSFDFPRSISNLTKTVFVISRSVSNHWVCRAADSSTKLYGAGDDGCILLPDKWLMPIRPSAGELEQVRSPKPFHPEYAIPA